MSINMVSEIVQKKVSEIKPYVRNPRKNDKTVELLTQVIPKVGFNVPIVIDKEGVIVKGHARFTAAIRLKMDTVPCVITYADEETIKLDRIADNKISEFSEWMTEGLVEELKSMKTDFDYSSLGLPDMREMELPDMDMVGEADTSEDTPFAPTEHVPQAEYNTEEYIIANKSEIAASTPSPILGANVSPRVMSRFMKAVCPHCGKVRYIPEDQLEFK